MRNRDAVNRMDEKRLILIIDNEEDNREYLCGILQEHYEVVCARNAAEAERLFDEKKELLSLVLLDLILPDADGLELLRKIRSQKAAAGIPVIVITADHSAEAEAIGLGAIDFISKPFPPDNVILARIMRIIELIEDRHIIEITERDPLTGLYNKEYCYRYAEQFDRHHKEMKMDAILVDINHFHMVNERYGKAFADDVLIRLGRKLNEMVSAAGGIVCRREADTFLVYCPHRDDYEAMFEYASSELTGENDAGKRVRLRMGVYSDADKTLEIGRRFDRAKMAADSVKDSFTGMIGIYDNAMNDSELYTEQLLEDFHTAMREGQFEVYYQPKFDIRTEIPVLTSAEALIRWHHPKLGMISPMDFIPLFEKNGLIRELDSYVWRETARQISRWKEKFNLKVPVSVNVSRVDMYDPDFINELSMILEEQGLVPSDIYLEITETAYTGESEHIIEVVNELRRIGFKIEMDDFGSGYSSLNMISNLPIDALKLDMEFIRNAFRDEKDMKMIEAMIDIADYLTVPVIAEGVETEEQFCALKMMGCDVVQGFYFSAPVPVKEYEPFLLERRKISEDRDPFERINKGHNIKRNGSDTRFGNIAYALSSGFERIFYLNVESGHYLEFSDQGRYEDLQIRKSGDDFYADVKKIIEQYVFEPDRKRVEAAVAKETLLSNLSGNRVFSMACRRISDGDPVYYDLKFVKASIRDDRYVIIGMSCVDFRPEESFTKELEKARRLVNMDALTGVRNKYSYVKMEKEINLQIAGNEITELGIAVCDLNSLKKINDTYGHNAGDEYIREGCSLICETFKHSPVFRIGGDEFVVILKGNDYRNREKLEQLFKEKVLENSRNSGVVVAFGRSDYNIGEDLTVEHVFDRADAAMYLNKKQLKNGG